MPYKNLCCVPGCHDKLSTRDRLPLYTNEVGIEGPAVQICLNDHLTSFNKQLLSHALEEKIRGNVVAAWTFRGKIYARKQNKQRSAQVKDTWSLDEVIKNIHGR
ncbi:hypothetical protein PR048_001615, partial [Dryococelus australis]